MNASTLYGLGVLTIALPTLLGNFLKPGAVGIYVSEFNFYDMVILVAGFAGMWVLTSLIDRRWKLVRK